MTDRRPRLWIVTPELHTLMGTERCLVEQVRRWREAFDITVYTTMVRDVDLSDVTIRLVPGGRGPHLARFLWWLIANRLVRARDMRRRGRPDILFSPGTNALDADVVAVHMIASRGRFESRGQRRRERWSSLSGAARALHADLSYAILEWLEGRIYRRALLWVPNARDAEWLARQFDRLPDEVVAIPHGVDRADFPPRGVSSSPDTRLLLVGNDIHGKGIDTAIAALRYLPREVTLDVAGLLPQRDLDAIARPLGLADRVRALPRSAHILDYYDAAAVVVAPSREDTFGLPVLEAMSCGVPVVASSRAGVSELWSGDETAVVTLSDPEDAEDLARKVSMLLGDEQLRQRSVGAGEQIAEKASWNVNALRTEEVLRAALVRKRQRHLG